MNIMILKIMGVTPSFTGCYTQLIYYQRFAIIPLQQPVRQPDVRWAHGMESKMRSSCQP